jgi:hypothetical protein
LGAGASQSHARQRRRRRRVLDPSLSEPVESYQLDIFDGATLKRSVACATANFTYTAAMQTADFGSLPSSLRLQVAQLGANGATGLKKELTIPL